MSPSRATTERRPTCRISLKDHADRVRALIDQGAIVYVCGDGGRMEPDVKRTLVAMYDEACVARLAADNRYVLDVWASS